MTDLPFNSDYHIPGTVKIKKTVTPDKPIADYNAWIIWIYTQIKKIA